MAQATDFEELFGVNAAYVEKVYRDYLADPAGTNQEWVRFFEEHLPAEMLPKPADSAAAGEVEPEAVPPEAPVPAATPAPVQNMSRGASGPPAPEEELEPLRGVAGRIVTNMEESLGMPTATSTREIPVKVLEENRSILNKHLQGEFRGKASFTHVIAWAMVQALDTAPGMAVSYRLVNGKPMRRQPKSINVGLAIDLPRPDGGRTLVVPNIKDAQNLDFAGFLAAYNAQVRKARDGKLTPEDFADTTFTLTNPGTIGTVSSLPRLMAGQSFILATGAISVPAAYSGAAPSTLNELGVSRVMTLTSTYDHRVIQGAESGQYLARMHQLLLGEDEFYERIFHDLHVPYRPVHWTVDKRPAMGSSLREAEALERAAKVFQYIRSYRVRGYVLANLDPLRGEPMEDFPELDISNYGLTLWDKDREFFSSGVTERPFASLREIQEVLHATYTRQIGVEFMHIADPKQKDWLVRRMEGNRNEEALPKEIQLKILDALVEAEAFEQFLHTKFVGHKRFSLEGGEALIPALEGLLDRGAEHGVEQAVIGMAHRGRLNVLAHILGKPMAAIFSEFEGHLDVGPAKGSGDVKYHLGQTGTYNALGDRKVELQLTCNPSHLEAVNPVVEGITRALQDGLQTDGASREDSRKKVLPILVHGDAAFAGQGVVTETLQMSQLPGYGTGGTVHIVVNNQIGYTTKPRDARSTYFCSDVAKAIQAPVFHVNGDNPLAVVRMLRLAMDYREEFGRDVVVDVVCYRRHGHNEGDEPTYTQPLMYRTIAEHPTVRQQYQDFLVRAKVLERSEIESFDVQVQRRLKETLDSVRQLEQEHSSAEVEHQVASWPSVGDRVAQDQLEAWIDSQLEIPDGFHVHEKAYKILQRRGEMVRGKQPIDFATGEALAFASLLTGGVPIRLAGQDSGRGTFSQRHSVWVDVEDGHRHIPLQHLAEDQGRFEVVDSLLSEEAALGFEYGYSTTRPEALVLWEAQFGDFCNGAQIQIDQFLAAGEAKWGQQCGTVLLLPHGYDGQGPEHSSARLERFLQLCAEDNLRVAYPSTAAQYFHLLRRQGMSEHNKPLVVMTPKSMLRMKAAGSSPEELTGHGFEEVIADPVPDAAAVERVVCCTGKVYHELKGKHGDLGDGAAKVRLVRVELLYPWPHEPMAALKAEHPDAEFLWCQEEPRNMGAWTHVRDRFPFAGYVGRPAAASPATGSPAAHKAQQEALVSAALDLGATVEPVSLVKL